MSCQQLKLKKLGGLKRLSGFKQAGNRRSSAGYLILFRQLLWS